MTEENYIAMIQATDPNFNVSDFKKWCQDTLILLQEAWSKKDKETLSKYETEKLHALHTKQLEAMEFNEVVNITKDMCIDSVEIINFNTSKTEVIIKVILHVSLIDYYTKCHSSTIIKGSREPISVRYKLSITRPKEFQSNQLISNQTTNCPHCGAPIKNLSLGKCEYCRNILMTMNNVYKIKTISI